jgi:hypothetical protein
MIERYLYREKAACAREPIRVTSDDPMSVIAPSVPDVFDLRFDAIERR